MGWRLFLGIIILVGVNGLTTWYMLDWASRQDAGVCPLCPTPECLDATPESCQELAEEAARNLDAMGCP